MDLSSTIVMELVFTVQSAGAGGFWVEQTISHSKGYVAIMGISKSYDFNTWHMDSPIAERFKAMLSSSMEGIVAPNGRVTVLKNFEMPRDFSAGPARIDHTTPLSFCFVAPPPKPIPSKGT